jgi:hypothetical protein
METSVNDVLIVIGLDFLLFLLLFLGFAVYRKLRSKKIEIELDVSVLKPYMHEAEYSSFEIAGKVKNMSLTEIYSEVGEWAFVYLNIHKFMAISLLILSVPGCCVLLVLYTYGDEEDEYKDIQKTGISSIIKNPDFLIVPAIFLVVFSLALYVYGWFFLKVILNTKPRSPALVTDELTVMVKGIPKDFSSEFVSAIIEKNLRNDYFKSLINVYTVPHWIDAFSYYRKFLECEKKLKFLMFDLQCSGKRPVIRKFCKKIDGIEFYEMEKNRNLKKVAELKKEFKHMNAGVAFVQFSNRTAAKMLLMAGMNPSQAMNPVNWECSAAPVSCDLIWENLGIDISYAIFRKILINFLFIIAFLVLITPSYLEAIIKKYLDYLNLTSLIVGTLAVSLPSLILVIYQLIILPPAVNFMVQQEKHTKKHLQISSRLRKYFFFLLFYTLFFPILGLQFIGFIELFVEGNWKFELGTKVNMTGQLFFIFLIHQAFLKNGFDLLVASKYIWSATKAILASTNAEKKICYEAEPFEFDFELAVALNTFCITCSLSLIFPLVLLPGLLFFTMRVIFI